MRQISWFILLIFFTSCYNENNKNIDHETAVIPKKAFIKLLTDIHKADSYFSVTKQNLINDSILNPKNFYGEVFQKYGVTNKEFQATILYYCYNMQEFESICEQVVQNLNQEIDSLQIVNKEQ